VLPLVGAVIGALAGTIGFVASLRVTHVLAAALTLAALVILSGAIHIDGFLDGCDAFFASVPLQRRFEILDDPRHGTFALAGLFSAGIVWYAALLSLAPATYPVLLAFSGALARAAAVCNALVFPYARPRAQAHALSARPAAWLLALELLALVAAAWTLGHPVVLFVPLAVLAALATGRWIALRLGGGLTGDAYGFITVVLEITLLAALSALQSPYS